MWWIHDGRLGNHRRPRLGVGGDDERELGPCTWTEFDRDASYRSMGRTCSSEREVAITEPSDGKMKERRWC
jgi:hypothetical protein